MTYAFYDDTDDRTTEITPAEIEEMDAEQARAALAAFEDTAAEIKAQLDIARDYGTRDDDWMRRAGGALGHTMRGIRLTRRRLAELGEDALDPAARKWKLRAEQAEAALARLEEKHRNALEDKRKLADSYSAKAIHRARQATVERQFMDAARSVLPEGEFRLLLEQAERAADAAKLEIAA